MSYWSYERIVAGLMRRLQYPLDRYYDRRHPGRFARACILLMAPIVRHMFPNDKWSLGVHAPFWMKAIAKPTLEPMPSPRRLFLFTNYRGQFNLDLSLAALLAWRGHKVTVGYLPRLGSPIKPPLTDHASAAPYLAAALSGVERASGGRVRIIDLTKYFDPEVLSDPAIVERQAKSDSVMRLGCETIDRKNPEHVQTFDHYRALSEQSQHIAHGFLSRHHKDFDLALIPNGMTFEGAHFAQAAPQYHLNYVTFEKFAFRKIRFAAHEDVVFSFRDFSVLWDRRAELGFENEPFRSQAIARAGELLDERRRSSTQHWALKYQIAPNQTDIEALRAAGLKQGQPFVLVTTNVPYDAGYYHYTQIFPSMKEWLVQTVRCLLDTTDVQVVVRIHPAEVLHTGNRERSVETLRASGLMSNPRLRVIGPDEKINTYPLMQNCRAGAVFSSTTGIEMAMLGRPVVVGSDVYFANKGFTKDCKTIEEYLKALTEAAKTDISPAESKRISELAKIAYYLMHFVLQHPYPYDKRDDIRRNPPHRLVEGSDIARYIPFLDVVTTPVLEFERDLPRIYGRSKSSPADRCVA
jgi:hypothetical protein